MIATNIDILIISIQLDSSHEHLKNNTIAIVC